MRKKNSKKLKRILSSKKKFQKQKTDIYKEKNKNSEFYNIFLGMHISILVYKLINKSILIFL